MEFRGSVVKKAIIIEDVSALGHYILGPPGASENVGVVIIPHGNNALFGMKTTHFSEERVLETINAFTGKLNGSNTVFCSTTQAHENASETWIGIWHEGNIKTFYLTYTNKQEYLDFSIACLLNTREGHQPKIVSLRPLAEVVSDDLFIENGCSAVGHHLGNVTTLIPYDKEANPLFGINMNGIRAVSEEYVLRAIDAFRGKTKGIIFCSTLQVSNNDPSVVTHGWIGIFRNGETKTFHFTFRETCSRDTYRAKYLDLSLALLSSDRFPPEDVDIFQSGMMHNKGIYFFKDGKMVRGEEILRSGKTIDYVDKTPATNDHKLFVFNNASIIPSGLSTFGITGLSKVDFEKKMNK